MDTIVISAATGAELADLIGSCGAESLPGYPPLDLHLRSAPPGRIIFARTGVGKAMAAATTAALIHHFTPDLIINTGCAGAYPGSELLPGDLALAETETFADEGVEIPGGWLSLQLAGVPLWEADGRRCGNEIPLDGSLVAAARETAHRLGMRCVSGGFLTVSTCSGTRMRGETLSGRFRGICENMEGASVALVSSLYGIPCLEVRGISNLVEDRDLSRWDIHRAAAAAAAFLERFLEEIRT